MELASEFTERDNKKRKVYFLDNGIRNAIFDDFRVISWVILHIYTLHPVS